MFVPMPCLLALLLPTLVGLPVMAGPWSRRARHGTAILLATCSIAAFVLSCLAYGPGTAPFTTIARIAYL